MKNIALALLIIGLSGVAHSSTEVESWDQKDELYNNARPNPPNFIPPIVWHYLCDTLGMCN